MAILATTEIAVFVLINYVDGIWKRLCGYLFLLYINHNRELAFRSCVLRKADFFNPFYKILSHIHRHESRYPASSPVFCS